MGETQAAQFEILEATDGVSITADPHPSHDGSRLRIANGTQCPATRYRLDITCWRAARNRNL